MNVFWPHALLVAHLGWGALWLWALCRRLSGQPVGPSVEFARRLSIRPQTPPAPPNPNLEVWKPWFGLYGPLFLELKYASGMVPQAWRGRVHERAAYRLYMHDRLSEAIVAATEALQCGTRPDLWAVRLLSVARAELEARQTSTTVESPPFVFELPRDDRQFDALVEVAKASSARTEAMLGFSPGPVTFALLDEQELRREAGSRWGYVVPKAQFTKVCLLRPAAGGLTEASVGLVHEYTRLAILELSAGRAPQWLTDGIGDWMVQQTVGDLAPAADAGPPTALRRLRADERTLQRMLRRSVIERIVDRGASPLALVTHLIEVHGEAAMRSFVTGLARHSEGSAFRTAFGVSRGQFARQWCATVGKAA